MGKIIKENVRKGFTLVELSIVLAIIGLLVGGITAGMSLLTNQRKNSILTKATSLRMAYWQFKSKYGYKAGDFPLATTVWGRADNGAPVTSNCAAPQFDNANPQGTCNGDGDGTVEVTESVRLWQQLKLAGFISDPMTGINPSSPVPGVNYPITDYRAKAYYTRLWGVESPAGDYTDAFDYGASGASLPGGAAVLSGEADFSLDKKIDDGLPLTGQLCSMTYFDGPANCHSGSGAGATYNATRTDDVCVLIFMNNDPATSN